MYTRRNILNYLLTTRIVRNKSCFHSLLVGVIGCSKPSVLTQCRACLVTIFCLTYLYLLTGLYVYCWSASRYRSAIPSLFNRPASHYEFRHSNYTGRGDRTRDSACAFAQGLWGTCGMFTSVKRQIIVFCLRQ